MPIRSKTDDGPPCCAASKALCLGRFLSRGNLATCFNSEVFAASRWLRHLISLRGTVIQGYEMVQTAVAHLVTEVADPVTEVADLVTEVAPVLNEPPCCNRGSSLLYRQRHVVTEVARSRQVRM